MNTKFKTSASLVIDSQIPEEYKVNNPATKESSYSQMFSHLSKAESTLGHTPTAPATPSPNLNTETTTPDKREGPSVKHMPGLFSSTPTPDLSASNPHADPKP